MNRTQEPQPRLVDAPPVPSPVRPEGYPGVPLTALRLRWTSASALCGAVALTPWLLAVALRPAVESWSPAAQDGLRFASYVLLYGSVVAVMWVVARARRVGFRDAVGLRPADPYALAGLPVVATYAWLSLTVLVTVELTALGVEVPRGLDYGELFSATPLGRTMMLLVAVVLAPIGEEVLIRGVLFPSLRDRFGRVAGIAVSAAVFGVMHLNPVNIVAATVIGLVLAWLFDATRSLWVPIASHALYNGLLTLFLFSTLR